MRVTMDIERKWIEALQKEFSTTDIKDAFYQLLEFYKKTKTHFQEHLEVIEETDSDYGFIEEARKRREKGEKTYSLDAVLKEFE